MKVLETKRVKCNIEKASVTVTLADDTEGCIEFTGTNTPLVRNEWPLYMTAEARLEEHLTESMLILSDGRRIPTCNIREISTTKVEDYIVTFEITRHRDWGLLPFGWNVWKEKIVTSYR